MRVLKKFLFCVSAICLAQASYAVELKIVVASTSHGPELGTPPRTIDELKQETHQALLDKAGPNHSQVSAFIDAEVFCDPVYQGSQQCYRGRVVSQASFVESSKALEPRTVTLRTRANPYDRTTRRVKALELGLEKAKALCASPASLDKILDEKDLWDPTYYEITATYSCQ